jgi:hypothetical protein
LYATATAMLALDIFALRAPTISCFSLRCMTSPPSLR